MALPTQQHTDIPSDPRSAQDVEYPLSTSHQRLAQESLARDLELDPEDAEETEEPTLGRVRSNMSGYGTTNYPTLPEHSLSTSYRRNAILPGGITRAGIVNSVPLPASRVYLTEAEQQRVYEEERSLLRDNHIIPPKHPRRGSGANSTKSLISTIRERVKQQGSGNLVEEEEAVGEGVTDEETPLIPDAATLPYGGEDSPANISNKWEDAVTSGKIQTTWQREFKVISKYSRSLIITYILQYSLPVASIFTVGHIGKVELCAASLGSMTANITGYAVYIGLATSLDTLCAQAYGSGRKKLVGLQMQRMVLFLWVITVPIGAVWLSGTQILKVVVPDERVAELAGLYLKVALIGAPGYAAAEAGKRFLLAQGLFSSTFYVLIVLAPLNAFLHWLFVWKLNFGFVGAPMALTIIELLFPLGLFLYVVLVDGRECWGGFSSAALRNWGPMIRLALPGLLMVLAEFLAFEILTLASSWMGTTQLAAQTVLMTICAMAYQLPFPISVATSNRVANLIGATLAPAAKISSKVAMVMAVVVGLLNAVLLMSLRYQLPRLITSEEDVIQMAADVLPVCAAFQLADSTAAHVNGILRGIGRQGIGGWVNLGSYYVVGVPMSLALGFGLKLGLTGLWMGPATGLLIVTVVEGWYLMRTSWDEAVKDAVKRNAGGLD